MPSSIGRSDSGNANLQFNEFTTLKYVGAGDETNRRFTYISTWWGERPFTIDASGTGPIHFTTPHSPSVTIHRMSYTMNLIGTNTDDNMLDANLANTGSGGVVAVTKDGPGKWVLTGICTNSGATTVNDGTLEITGSMNNSSATSNAGAMIAGGGSVKNLTVNTDGGYVWAYGDDANHAMNVTTNLTLADNWVLKLVDLGDDPLASQQYELLTYGGTYTGDAEFSEALANLVVDTTHAPDWNVSALSIIDDEAGRLYITGISGATPGDANGDDVVDAADYMALKQNLGAGPGASQAQGDVADGALPGQDGYVNMWDLNLMAEALNNPAGGGTIPEPATLGLLVLGALAMVRRRRERK
jgi:autotransporter-associated beta strand protein